MGADLPPPPPPGEIGLRIELEHFGHCCIGFGCEMIPLQVYQSCGLPAMCRVQRAEESSSEIGQDKILGSCSRRLQNYLHSATAILFPLLPIQILEYQTDVRRCRFDIYIGQGGISPQV